METQSAKVETIKGATKANKKAAPASEKPRRQTARKSPLPIIPGLSSGETRKLRLSGSTMSLIKGRTSATEAAPSDAIFVASVMAMGRKKHQLPAVPKIEEVEVQLPPAVWEFLDAQAQSSKSDIDTLIHTYLGLL